ncbi:MAG: hypothetical protein ABW352_25445 [Polyangiales bacterium]
MGSEDLRARLREQPAPVRYDVSRGLARHRALVDANTALPAWASEPVARSAWWRRAAWWAGALVLLTLFVARSTREPVREPMPGSARVSSAEPAPNGPVTRLSEPRTLAPQVVPPQPQPGHAESAPEAPAHADTAAAPSAPARAHARTRPREHARAVREATSETGSDDAHATAPSMRAVAPEENRELAQLVEAERALKSEPVRALRLAREGELSFRNGYFAQERQYIEVMALFTLGRLGEAHAKAAAYLRDYPGAPYRRKVELEMLRQPQH